ncbi:MAG: hypothetical protein ABSE73_29155, partial [Planctomycetota bacterium]
MAQGTYRGQEAALALVRRIAYLPGSVAVKAATRAYLDAGVVPQSKPGDAAHLAYASVHRMDYLLGCMSVNVPRASRPLVAGWQNPRAKAGGTPAVRSASCIY